VQTIIECLKMASTGDLPPNVRSGQNFIHDPKVAGEAEVKAQIKMCFNSQFKGSFMVIRNFSLSQKKKTLQFKALDNALSIWDPNISAYHALPQRCSNINQEVPFSMGVNKAILENVIFVHQEDSNWPLSEPANVKKRFDDIFAATKYTKALEEIRKLKSKEQTEAKEKRLQLETLRSHRDGAHRLRNTILENEQSSAAHSNNIESLKLEIQKISSQIDALQLEVKEISQKKEQVSSIKATYDILARKVEEMKLVMLEKYSEDDLEASIEDLEEYQTEFNPRLVQMEESMQQIRQYIFEVEEDLKLCISEKENVVRSHGQVIGAAGSYRKSVATLHSLAHEANNTFQLDISVGPGDDSVQRSSVNAFITHLGVKGQEIESEIRDVKLEQKRREESMQSTIDSINDAISAAKQTIRNSSEKVQANSQQSETLERQISQLQRNLNADVAEQLKDLQKSLHISQQELTQLEENARNLTIEQKINNAAEKIREADAKIHKLRADRSKLAAEGESFLRAKIMLQELDKVKEKERNFRSLHASKVAITLGVLPSAVPHDGDDLVDQFKNWLKSKTLEAESLKSAQAALLTKYSEIDVRLKSKENALLKSKEELEELSKTLNTDLQAGTNLSDKVKELQSLRDERVKKVNFCDAYIEIWEKEKSHADQHSSCISCERVFQGEDAKEEYVAKKQAMINELPQQVSQAQKEIQELESKLQQLKIMEPDVQRYANMELNGLSLAISSCLSLFYLQIQKATKLHHPSSGARGKRRFQRTP
jgi:DNA repair protein RAD50